MSRAKREVDFVFLVTKESGRNTWAFGMGWGVCQEWLFEKLMTRYDHPHQNNEALRVISHWFKPIYLIEWCILVYLDLSAVCSL